MSQNIYRALLVMLIISLWITSLEISFLTSLLVIFVGFKPKLSRPTFSFISVLLVLFFIGFFSGIIEHDDIFSLVKDSVYFLRPITVLIAGYLIVSNLNNKKEFFNIIVLVGFVFAFVHVARIGIQTFGVQLTVDRLRNTFGRTNHLELVALFLVIVVKDLPIKKFRSKILFKIFIGILALSFLLYFSRTMIMVLALMLLAYYGYLKLNAKGVIYLMVLSTLAAGFIIFLENYEPTRDETVFDSFMWKMKNSYEEAFKPIDVDKTLLDRRTLWGHWRAFEANLVYNEVDKQRDWAFGKGFGSTVDIGFEIKLQGEWIRHLPMVHNGLAYVYLKTGIVGLFVYFMCLVILYSYFYKKGINKNEAFYNRMLASYAFYFLVSSMVITGIFRPYDMVTLLIGGTFALKQHSKFENRDSRDPRDS